MYECYVAREQYLQLATEGSERNISLLREFHSKVLNYYFALRRLRGRSEVKEKWQSARLLRPDRAIPAVPGAEATQQTVEAPGKDEDGWVYGLENLGPWADKKVKGQANVAGDTSNTRYVRAPAILAPEDLMRVSGILDDLAEELNLSARPTKRDRAEGTLPQAGES
jgi:hypothetical protein